MAYDIFRSFGLNRVKDSLTEDYDYIDNDSSEWKPVKTKSVMDSDGFMTDYTWYTNGEKHIFMFGDSDIYEPDEAYADWECETHSEASEWFDSYNGFEDEDPWSDFEEDDFEESLSGNSDFMNDGFDRTYGNGLDLED